MAGPMVPVVDVSVLSLEKDHLDLENIDLQHLGSQLRAALQHHGFVYISGHGVDEHTVHQVMGM